MDALNINTPIYVVSGQAGTEHVVIKAFLTYDAARIFMDEQDKKWSDKGWKHFITCSFLAV